MARYVLIYDSDFQFQALKRILLQVCVRYLRIHQKGSQAQLPFSCNLRAAS